MVPSFLIRIHSSIRGIIQHARTPPHLNRHKHHPQHIPSTPPVSPNPSPPNPFHLPHATLLVLSTLALSPHYPLFAVLALTPPNKRHNPHSHISSPPSDVPLHRPKRLPSSNHTRHFLGNREGKSLATGSLIWDIRRVYKVF